MVGNTVILGLKKYRLKRPKKPYICNKKKNKNNVGAKLPRTAIQR